MTDDGPVYICMERIGGMGWTGPNSAGVLLCESIFHTLNGGVCQFILPIKRVPSLIWISKLLINHAYVSCVCRSNWIGLSFGHCYVLSGLQANTPVSHSLTSFINHVDFSSITGGLGEFVLTLFKLANNLRCDKLFGSTQLVTFLLPPISHLGLLVHVSGLGGRMLNM